MRALMIIAWLVAAIVSAQAYTVRDSPAARFDNDIRANSESLRSRLDDRSNRIEPQNSRLRERLYGTNGSHRLGSRLRRSN